MIDIVTVIYLYELNINLNTGQLERQIRRTAKRCHTCLSKDRNIDHGITSVIFRVIN